MPLHLGRRACMGAAAPRRIAIPFHLFARHYSRTRSASWASPNESGCGVGTGKHGRCAMTRKPTRRKSRKSLQSPRQAQTTPAPEHDKRSKSRKKPLAMPVEGAPARSRLDRPSRGAPRQRFQAGGSPYSPVNGTGGYVPTVQITMGRGAPPPPGLPQQQSGIPSFNDAYNLGKMINPQQGNTVYGGHDYGDAETAEAARAGVQSGMSFDPETGDVWKRGGAVKGRRRR